jgi:hypothetical protein
MALIDLLFLSDVFEPTLLFNLVKIAPTILWNIVNSFSVIVVFDYDIISTSN